MTSAPSVEALMAEAGIDPAIHKHISQTIRILIKIADVALAPTSHQHCRGVKVFRPLPHV